jgi:hypothetical protein
LRKDKTFRGGDLEIYGKGNIFTKKLCKTIKPNNNILCFDGDIYHKVTDFEGFGIRDCIVIQFGKKILYSVKYLIRKIRNIDNYFLVNCVSLNIKTTKEKRRILLNHYIYYK